jgi:phosphogluconate dehydratase
MALHPTISGVTDRIIERSRPTRQRYLDLMAEQKERGISRPRLSCGNFAHGFAAAGEDKASISTLRGPNVAIVTAYNDMLSAHQPYGRYPEQIKVFAREVGATAQVAGGVPAMCDGVTQGQPGMDLSLFSRDVIAMSTAVALSHGMFDAAALLGICDKIVPGLLIGALRYGHLPMLLVPGGPMPSGLPNKEKQRIRQLYAEGKAGKDELLEAESRSYHGPGTCTFYGTANSNQMMMELMGLHVPNAAFINPGTPLRQALTRAAVHRLAELARSGERPLAHVVDEKAILNAMIGLLATGGSTNHFIHLPAIARAAGIIIDWEDFADLSSVVPLITRVYPNGSKDVNDFQDAGGMAFVTYTLSREGLIHTDTLTAGAESMDAWIGNPELHGDELIWKSAEESADIDMLRPASDPFRADGGLRLVQGNLGRAVFKTSAVDEERWLIEAPARCFSDQNEVLDAFKAGELDRDCAVVVRFQGLIPVLPVYHLDGGRADPFPKKRGTCVS